METFFAFFGSCMIGVMGLILIDLFNVFEFVNEEKLMKGEVFKVSDNLEYQCKPTDKTVAILLAESELKKLKR